MEYDGKKIVYIEYQDRKPWQVIADNRYYSFELINGDYYWREDGMGRCPNPIPVGQLAEPQNPPMCQIWHDKDYTLEGILDGYEILQEPILFEDWEGNMSGNPLEVFEDSPAMDYCQICGEWYHDGCDEHYYCPNCCEYSEVDTKEGECTNCGYQDNTDNDDEEDETE